MRLGYTLNEYRYKIGLQESPLCSCGAIETVDHYICECEVYELDRQKLLTRLFYKTGEQGIIVRTEIQWTTFFFFKMSLMIKFWSKILHIQSNFDGSNSSGPSVRVRPIHVFERYLARQFSSWFMCTLCHHGHHVFLSIKVAKRTWHLPLIKKTFAR